jgi:hypothetical protein
MAEEYSGGNPEADHLVVLVHGVSPCRIANLLRLVIDVAMCHL